jgi:hypothetical protein
VPLEQTQRLMSAYFDALDTGSFAEFYTDDVTWTTIEDGSVVTGPEAVQGAINALHARLTDLQTRQIVFGTQSTYLEGSAAGPTGGARIAYCVAYDLLGDHIAAMRAYGALAEDTPTPRGVVDG